MKKFNPFNPKFDGFYMSIAEKAALESVDRKRKVGAVIVLPSGMIGLGWNGMPTGFDNECQSESWSNSTCTLTTKPEVIHAERNALDKLTREGVSPEEAVLFVTTAPCIECAKSIASVGITDVHYLNEYKNKKGIDHLVFTGVRVHKFDKET